MFLNWWVQQAGMPSRKEPKSKPRCISEIIEQHILERYQKEIGLYNLATDDAFQVTYANGLAAIFAFARGDYVKAVSLYQAINEEIGQEDGCYNWAKVDSRRLPEANRRDADKLPEATLTMAILLKLLGCTSAARDLEQNANKLFDSHKIDADALALKGVLRCLFKDRESAESLYQQINEQVEKKYGLYMTTPKWRTPIAPEPNSLMNGIMGIFCHSLGRKGEAVDLCRTVRRVIGIKNPLPLYRWSRDDDTAWLDANAAMGTLHCLRCKGGFFAHCPER